MPELTEMNVPLINRHTKELIGSAEMLILNIEQTYYQGGKTEPESYRSLVHAMQLSLNEIKGELK